MSGKVDIKGIKSGNTPATHRNKIDGSNTPGGSISMASKISPSPGFYTARSNANQKTSISSQGPKRNNFMEEK
jgi:hypothetical protein